MNSQFAHLQPIALLLLHVFTVFADNSALNCSVAYYRPSSSLVQYWRPGMGGGGKSVGTLGRHSVGVYTGFECHRLEGYQFEGGCTALGGHSRSARHVRRAVLKITPSFSACKTLW